MPILFFKKDLPAESKGLAELPSVSIQGFAGQLPKTAASDCRRLLQAFPRNQPWSAARLAAELLSAGQDGMCWTAQLRATDRAVGMCSLRRRGVEGHINWLVVDPDFRRLGIATQLLRTAEDFAFGCGCRSAHVETLQDWHAAVRFYQRCGYVSS